METSPREEPFASPGLEPPEPPRYPQPQPVDPGLQGAKDAEHLNLLVIFYYVVAGLGAVFGLFPIFHLGFGIMMLVAPGSFSNPNTSPSDVQMMRMMGIMFTVMAAFFILLAESMALALFFTGRYLKARKRYMFCLIVAGLACMNFPFGTALGVCTLIVLMRPSVKRLFEMNAAADSGRAASPGEFRSDAYR